MSTVCWRATPGCLLLAALLLVGCSHRHEGGPAGSISQRAIYLSPDKASRLAAELANTECERRFHKRPFRPEQHAAVLQDGKYKWGGLDPGAPGGYSALVIFEADGGHPKVEVYYSTDTL
jgi:hypothetical protein